MTSLPPSLRPAFPPSLEQRRDLTRVRSALWSALRQPTLWRWLNRRVFTPLFWPLIGIASGFLLLVMLLDQHSGTLVVGGEVSAQVALANSVLRALTGGLAKALQTRQEHRARDARQDRVAQAIRDRVAGVPLPVAETLRCHVCSKPTLLGARYCAYCHTDLLEVPEPLLPAPDPVGHVCLTCGERSFDDARFCSGCGAALAPTVPSLPAYPKFPPLPKGGTAVVPPPSAKPKKPKGADTLYSTNAARALSSLTTADDLAAALKAVAGAGITLSSSPPPAGWFSYRAELPPSDPATFWANPAPGANSPAKSPKASSKEPPKEPPRAPALRPAIRVPAWVFPLVLFREYPGGVITLPSDAAQSAAVMNALQALREAIDDDTKQTVGVTTAWVNYVVIQVLKQQTTTERFKTLDKHVTLIYELRP